MPQILTLTLPRHATVAPGLCYGDCDSSGDVTVNELITIVTIARGNAPLSACSVGDADHSGDITINEIIAAVNNDLTGCPPRGLPLADYCFP